MVQLIGLALVGGIAWIGYRKFRSEMERVNKETRSAEHKKKKDNTVLVPDEDGVYRPKEKD
ncbi:MAG: hypothetical protein AAF217_03585 [Pseudomonadota bacterium]